ELRYLVLPLTRDEIAGSVRPSLHLDPILVAVASRVGRRLRVVEQIVRSDTVLPTELRIGRIPHGLGEQALDPVGRLRAGIFDKGGRQPAAIGGGIGVVILDESLAGV